MVLLGQPFNVLTESVVKNFGNGDQEITITDPNLGRQSTMGTFKRGKILGMKKRIDTSRYDKPIHKDVEHVLDARVELEEGNFQASKI